MSNLKYIDVTKPKSGVPDYSKTLTWLDPAIKAKTCSYQRSA